jgi:hypothetical protein
MKNNNVKFKMNLIKYFENVVIILKLTLKCFMPNTIF